MLNCSEGPQRATESCSIIITQTSRKIWSKLLTQTCRQSIIGRLSQWGLKDLFDGTNAEQNDPKPVMITG
jgi:hypothetical protein